MLSTEEGRRTSHDNSHPHIDSSRTSIGYGNSSDIDYGLGLLLAQQLRHTDRIVSKLDPIDGQ